MPRVLDTAPSINVGRADDAGDPIGLGLRAYGDNSASPDFPPFNLTQPIHSSLIYVMDSSVFGGLLFILGAIYGILFKLFYWSFSLLYWLASPFLYLLNGLLTIALFPLQILVKFEVGLCSHHSTFYNPLALLT